MLETRTKQAKIWEHRHYLALDEISMISKDFLALLARNIAIGKGSPEDRSFSGISVIMLGLGDFHRFPPVARPLPDALYYPVDFSNDSLTSQLVKTRAIYDGFTTVVELKEQRRLSDHVWHDFLQHLRRGTA